MPHLFCFGLGFSAQALIGRLKPQGWQISGTNRDGAALEGVTLWRFDGSTPIPETALDGVTHLLLSVPPGEGGDPVINAHRDVLRRRSFDWVGYLSTVGVYGDAKGAWIMVHHK